ncbi:MAG: GNAT family N-acetyltransferase [Clostridiales bacterium 38-18]|nr:MAG: GNAT family N-acetyltransferase [Clostridiales bacterium 38-18]
MLDRLNHRGTLTIETERLILRRYKSDDAFDMFHNWASDSEVTRFLSWAPHDHIEITKEIIEIWMNQYQYDHVYNWGIQLKHEGTLIGGISVVALNETHFSCEIGYCIGKEYWGNGITTEAFSAIIPFLFDKVGMNRISANHDTQNIASGRVMQKTGLQYEGTARQARKRGSQFYDIAIYAITKDQRRNR